MTACTTHKSSPILATCILSPFVFVFKKKKMKPKQYKQGTQQSNGMNAQVDRIKTHASNMDGFSTRCGFFFSVPQLLCFHFQKSNPRVSVCLTDQLGQRHQDSDPGLGFVQPIPE